MHGELVLANVTVVSAVFWLLSRLGQEGVHLSCIFELYASQPWLSASVEHKLLPPLAIFKTFTDSERDSYSGIACSPVLVE